MELSFKMSRAVRLPATTEKASLHLRREAISTHGLVPLRRLIVCKRDNLLKELICESNSPCFDIALQVITSLREVPTPVIGVGRFGMLNRLCFLFASPCRVVAAAP